MTAARVLRVESLSVDEVSPSQCLSQRLRGQWSDEQMDVVRHQAVTQNIQPVLPRALSEEAEVELTITIGQKHVLPVVATLCNVVQDSRNNDSCYSRHAFMLQTISAPVQ
jgi:hypothetical protein